MSGDNKVCIVIAICLLAAFASFAESCTRVIQSNNEWQQTCIRQNGTINHGDCIIQGRFQQ